MFENSPEYTTEQKVRLGILVGIPLVIIACILIFFIHFRVTKVTILGNTHYSDQEIEARVRTGLFRNNTLILTKTRALIEPEEMQLVDAIEVSMISSHELLIRVMERQLTGYVRFLDAYMYFDADGRVVHSVAIDASGNSAGEETESTPGEETPEEGVLQGEEVFAVGKAADSFVAAMTTVPPVTGLTFDHVQIGKLLPVEDKKVFNTILGVTRMLNKYDIVPNEVHFNEDATVTLYYDLLTVELGNDRKLEEKLARAAAIMPQLPQNRGVLHLEDYDGSSENVIFSHSGIEAEELDEQNPADKGGEKSPAETDENAEETELSEGEQPAADGALPQETVEP